MYLLKLTLTRLNFFILFILLAILSYYLNIIFGSKITLFSDSAIYAEFTRFWIRENYQYVIHPFWPPLFPLISSIAYTLYPNIEQILRIVSAFSIVISLIPLYYLMRFTSDSKIAYIFIILVPFIYHISKIAVDPLSDALALNLICFSITTTFLSLEYKSKKLILLGGIFTGFLYLTRSEGSLFFILIMAYITLNALIEAWYHRLSFSLFPIYFLFGFVIISGIYLVMINIQLGSISLSPKFAAQIQQNHAFALRNNSSTWAQDVWSVKEPNYNSQYYNGELNYISNNFHPLFDLFLQRSASWRKIYLQSFPLWSIPIIIFGVITALRKHPRSTIFLMYMLSLAIPVTIFATALPDPRYLAWSFIFIMYFLFLGIYHIININFINKYPFILIAIIFTSAAILPVFKWDEIINPNVTISHITEANFRPELVTASEWIISRSKSNPRLLMRYEGIEYYADGTTVYMPQISIPQLINYAESNSVDYIIAWSRELRGDPELEILTNPTYTHPKLKQELLLNSKDGNMIIYSLR